MTNSNPFRDTEVQAMVRDSLRRLLARSYDHAARAGILERADGWSREIWTELAELGLLAMGIGEAAGGIGSGARDISVVSEELGRHLLIEPYCEVAVVAANLIAALEPAESREEKVAALVSGQTVAILANGLDEAMVAKRHGSAFHLSGSNHFIVGAPWADELLIVALLDGEPAVFRVKRDAPGVSLQCFRTLDSRNCAHLDLDAELEADALLATGECVVPALRHAALLRLVAHAGEAAGIMRQAVDATIAYARTREQFGQPIGRFQVLQHRIVDMHVAQREMAALVDALAIAIDSVDEEETLRWAAATRHRLTTSARAVGEEAVQIHGGMGMSEELPIGHQLRRLVAIGIQHAEAA